MDVLFYIGLSAVIIMIWHFAFGHPRNFGVMQMIGVFVLGGIAGYYMQSFETGILLSLVMALIFI